MKCSQKDSACSEYRGAWRTHGPSANFPSRAQARRAVLPTSGGRLPSFSWLLRHHMADLAQLTTQLTANAERLDELRRYL